MELDTYHVRFNAAEPSFGSMSDAINAAMANPRQQRANSITDQIVGRMIKGMSIRHEQITIILEGEFCLRLFLNQSRVDFEVLVSDEALTGGQDYSDYHQKFKLVTPSGDEYHWDPCAISASIRQQQLIRFGAFFSGVSLDLEFNKSRTLCIFGMQIDELGKEVLHFDYDV